MVTFRLKQNVTGERYFLILKELKICGKIYIESVKPIELEEDVSFTLRELADIQKVYKEWTYQPLRRRI